MGSASGRSRTDPPASAQRSDLSDLVEISARLHEIAAFRVADYTVAFSDTAQRLRGTRVTSSLFRVLRISPLLGRFFNETDAEDGAAPTVVLGHGLWRDRLAGRSRRCRRTLTIDGVNHEIVGVAPPDFAFPEREAGLRDDRREITLYTPFTGRPTSGAKVIDYFDAIARLKPGATPIRPRRKGRRTLAASIDRSRILFSAKAVRSKCASARGSMR